MWPNLFDGRSCSFQMENSLEFLLLIFSILHMCQLFLPFTYIFLVTSKWMSGNIPQKKKLPRPFQVLQGLKKNYIKSQRLAAQGLLHLYSLGYKQIEAPTQAKLNSRIQSEIFDAHILDICSYACDLRNTPQFHA